MPIRKERHGARGRERGCPFLRENRDQKTNSLASESISTLAKLLIGSNTATAQIVPFVARAIELSCWLQQILKAVSGLASRPTGLETGPTQRE